MKETTWRSSRQLHHPVSDFPADAYRESQNEVAARSHLVWGEHCTECSFPSCQFSCAFYTPRPDLTCQRFEAGIEAVASPGADVSRIVFRKWGKLEASGPSGLNAPATSRGLTAADRIIGSGLAAAPLPFEPKQAWIARWNRWKNRLPSSTIQSGDRARFVVEAWTPSPEPFEMTVTFLSGVDSRLFQRAFTVSREYMRIEIPVQQIAQWVDLEAPYLAQIEPVGEAAGREIYLGLADFVRFRESTPAPVAASGAPLIKVVVWDLDNTVWNGTLADDGLEGLTLRDDVVDTIRQLDRRGILNSIASKNDAPLAREALEKFGISRLFLAPQVGWEPKSDGIAAIAAALDLALDTFAFVDDLAFERAQVQTAHPMVAVFPETDPQSLLSNPRFDVPVTAESRRRREMYQAEHHRAQAYTPEKTDYRAFIASCDIHLTVAPLTPLTAERAFELTQRTNQLNFRASRLSRADVAALLDDGDVAALVLSCRDRFGDYGIVGFLVLELASGTVRDMYMSCRIQRKFVEHALVQHLLTRVATRGQTQLDFLYRPSERNGAAARLLGELGFERAPALPDERWSLSTTTILQNASLVSVELQERDLEVH